MKIDNSISYNGKKLLLHYEDSDDFSNLPQDKCLQVIGFCFYKGKLVIGREGNKNEWQILGGQLEEGESLEECLIREVREESNMKVLKSMPIGYQKVIGDKAEPYYQLRYACIVEPYGDFVSDPDGDIIAIKLIEPSQFIKYFKWGSIGDRIIERAQHLISFTAQS